MRMQTMASASASALACGLSVLAVVLAQVYVQSVIVLPSVLSLLRCS
jgi:hypothetical protein